MLHGKLRKKRFVYRQHLAPQIVEWQARASYRMKVFIGTNGFKMGGRLKSCTRSFLANTRKLTVVVYNELWRTRAFTAAAGLAYYFLLSLVPLIIVFASLLRFLPVNNIAFQLLGLIAALVPPQSMNLVLSAVAAILEPGHGKVLSFGVIGYLWAATGGFSALIEALNIAYDVEVSRPWWRDRLQAFLMTFTVGALGLFALLAILAGPHFGHLLMLIFPLPQSFGMLWPVLRWTIIVVTFIAGIELLYYLGPHARHSYWSTLPGALLAVGIWFAGSFGLSFYLSNMSSYNKTYGPLGAVIALMLWLYISGLAVLIGAELNAEWNKAKQTRKKQLEEAPCAAPQEQRTTMQRQRSAQAWRRPGKQI
ncbi:MAG TPA: YihY/virulence factor BrkB family protein [Pseudacidobacterium sp.]|nr:YihY/virulence factor BrkB family protein [Pseudacidobacterium sp.]